MIARIKNIEWNTEGRPESELCLPKAVRMFDLPPGETPLLEVQEGVLMSLSDAFGFEAQGCSFDVFESLDAIRENEKKSALVGEYFPSDFVVCTYTAPTTGVNDTCPRAGDIDKFTALKQEVRQLKLANERLRNTLEKSEGLCRRFRAVGKEAAAALRLVDSVLPYHHLKCWVMSLAESLESVEHSAQKLDFDQRVQDAIDKHNANEEEPTHAG